MTDWIAILSAAIMGGMLLINWVVLLRSKSRETSERDLSVREHMEFKEAVRHEAEVTVQAVRRENDIDRQWVWRELDSIKRKSG